VCAKFEHVLAEIAGRLPSLLDGECDEVIVRIDAAEEPVSDDVRKCPGDGDFRLLVNVVANVRPDMGRDGAKRSGGVDFGKPVGIEIQMMSV
jgi:hypothetical protein